MIYLDNAATTRVFDTAVSAAVNAMSIDYFNPNATYKSAVSVNDGIERARKTLAEILGAKPSELVFTSCATESNNTVFDCGIKDRNGNIVISAGEHSSVYECAMQLKSKGRDVRIAPLRPSGEVDREALLGLVDDKTALVSLIHVSNETGVVNPIKAITRDIKNKNRRTLVHSDGVQAVIKLHAPLDGLGVDYYSASAHKVGAPKGIGLLYIKDGLNIKPLLCGGGQEHGLRSGTQNTPYIGAFAEAAKQYNYLVQNNDIDGIRQQVNKFFEEHGCDIVGTAQNSGYISCIHVPGVKAEILQNTAHDRGVIIGKGAACSGSKRGNRVLSALGLSSSQIECCIRLSYSADTVLADALAGAKIIIDCANSIRSGNVK